MAPKKILPSLAAFLLFPSLVTSLQARTWTDVKGREIHADYISHTQSVVVLRMTNGKTYDVPLKHLSPADNRFINSGEAQKAIPDSGGNEAADMEEKGGDEESLNWDDEWPDSVKFEDDAEISVDKEDAEKNVFIYSSQNYRFTSDVRLSTSVVNSFVDLFEATRYTCLHIFLKQAL